jgi:hypothetical protein
MTNAANIGEIIKSRQNLRARGTDGISSRILQTAGKEGIQFVKALVRACIKAGRVMNS